MLLVSGAGHLGGVFAQAAPPTGVLDGAAALLVVSAVFWRSRFKYGLRGYRFALLEAGHAVQNAVLAATAPRFGSPIPGRYFSRPHT